MGDAEVVRLVTAWAIGFVVLVVIGVGVPVLCSFIPDAIALGRRRGQWKPLIGLVALPVVLVVLEGFGSTYTGAPGSPSRVVWGALTLLLAATTSFSAGGFTVMRALSRRSRQRQALAAVTSAPTTLQSAEAERSAPAALARMNAREAEHLACEWMHYLGAADAIVTPERRDGGVDVRSRDFLAQVKHIRNESVGVAVIRQLHGVAAAERRRALFFSTSGYSRDAIAFASSVGMALFVVRAHEGRLVPQGTIAQQYYLHGLELPHHRMTNSATKGQNPVASIHGARDIAAADR